MLAWLGQCRPSKNLPRDKQRVTTMQTATSNQQTSSNANSKANKAKQPKASKAAQQAAPVATPAPKASKPAATPKANSKAKQPAPVVTPAANRPGPKAGQQRVTVLGYSLYGFSQWFAAQGYNYLQCQYVLAKLAQNGSPNMATVKTAYSDVKNPKYSRPAPVSPAHAKQVAKLVKAMPKQAS